MSQTPLAWQRSDVVPVLLPQRVTTTATWCSPATLKNETKPGQRKTKPVVSPRWAFMIAGAALLAFLSIVPIWNAIVLEQNSNYVFWAGRRVPYAMSIGCISLVIFYVASVFLFFKKHHAEKDIENSFIILGNIFVMLFGLLLMLSSSPLTHQAELSITNLLHRCDVSEQTHRLYEYSQVLQNIRATPACAAKYSVEECDGYKDAAPYTTLLKGMENSFQCAGFCYSPNEASIASAMVPLQGLAPVQAAALAPSSATPLAPVAAPAAASPGAAPAASFLQQLPAAPRGIRSGYPRHHPLPDTTKRPFRQQHALSTETDPSAGSEAQLATRIALPTYPPTLFSDHNYQASCEGMAARDMKNSAGDVGQQLFCMGIYLVFLAVVTGFLRLVGFCQRKG